jgi:hypothetical protein
VNDKQRREMEIRGRALDAAVYMLARFRGEKAAPPADWTPDQVAALEEAFAIPEVRRQFIAWVVEGQRKAYEESVRAAMWDYRQNFERGGRG